jgi:hypothetical protein
MKVDALAGKYWSMPILNCLHYLLTRQIKVEGATGTFALAIFNQYGWTSKLVVTLCTCILEASGFSDLPRTFIILTEVSWIS